jgi:hypothetical protein
VLRACHRYSIFGQTAKVLLGSFSCGVIDQGVADHLLSALCHPGKQRLPPEADHSQSQNGDKGFDSMVSIMVVMRKPFLKISGSYLSIAQSYPGTFAGKWCRKPRRLPSPHRSWGRPSICLMQLQAPSAACA